MLHVQHKVKESLFYRLIPFMFLLVAQYTYATSSNFRFVFNNQTDNRTVVIHKKTGLSKCALFTPLQDVKIAPQTTPRHPFFFSQYHSCHYVKTVWQITVKDQSNHIVCASDMTFVMRKGHWQKWYYTLTFSMATNYDMHTPKCYARPQDATRLNPKFGTNGPYRRDQYHHRYYGFEFFISQNNHITYAMSGKGSI